VGYPATYGYSPKPVEGVFSEVRNSRATQKIVHMGDVLTTRRLLQ
jgi:hypothetical protein